MTAPEDQPYVKVTLDVIYNKLLDVDKKVDPVPEIVKDQGSRLRKLEIQVAVQWVAFGILTTAAGAALVRAFLPF
jgi:hypothetical protein